MFELDTRIILVEDTEITRTITKRMLAKMGYNRVTEAENGEIAWNLIKKVQDGKNCFQLIIADWKMPVMSGLELLEKLQDNDKTKEIPFVLLTSNIEREHVIEAIQSGVNHYVAKPFPAAALEKKLKEAWEFARKRKAA